MKTLAHWFLLSVVVGGCVVEGSRAQLPGSVTGGMPGRTPGTECWIVQCTRGYNLRQALQAIRQAAPALRPALIVGLRQQAQVDQAAIAQAVVTSGGVVRRHYWHLSALAVEVPASAVPVLRQLPRVQSLWPVTAGDTVKSCG